MKATGSRVKSLCGNLFRTQIRKGDPKKRKKYVRWAETHLPNPAENTRAVGKLRKAKRRQ